MLRLHPNLNRVFLFALAWILAGCLPLGGIHAGQTPLANPAEPTAILPTPLPTRATFKPGELVDYIAQSGDTLPALAARFNTTVPEIMDANPIIPPEATTMPPGMPMKIPIYYRALWGSPFKIIPDHAFVNSPTLIGFNTPAFVAAQEGWLRDYVVYAGGKWRTGAEVVDYIAQNYSVSPRLLLTILEYQGGALTMPEPPVKKNLLGMKRNYYESPYLQLVLAASALNNGYYEWRAGELLEFELLDGSIVRPDPWLNAASVSLQYYYSKMMTAEQYRLAVSPDGFYKTYIKFFGDPWQDPFTLIPGSLQQPPMELPFKDGDTWSYTGGPHTGWGSGEPLAAIDFAPPSGFSGCFKVEDRYYVNAMADGLIVRSGIDGVIQDLDNDGDERTGWVIFYLHLGTPERIPLGEQAKIGDSMGYPSCEGGFVTGTHIHIARKYNGEWILADGPLAFNLGGWIVRNGSRPYLGTLTMGNLTVRACECSDLYSQITAGFH